jgi:hypothetical protein
MMNLGQAQAVFENIDSDKYTEEEKGMTAEMGLTLEVSHN